MCQLILTKSVCLKLIDMLYKKGLINEATYFNVKRTYQNK